MNSVSAPSAFDGFRAQAVDQGSQATDQGPSLYHRGR